MARCMKDVKGRGSTMRTSRNARRKQLRNATDGQTGLRDAARQLKVYVVYLLLSWRERSRGKTGKNGRSSPQGAAPTPGFPGHSRMAGRWFGVVKIEQHPEDLAKAIIGLPAWRRDALSDNLGTSFAARASTASFVGGELFFINGEEDQLDAIGKQHQCAIRERFDVPQPFADPDRLAVNNSILSVETQAI